MPDDTTPRELSRRSVLSGVGTAGATALGLGLHGTQRAQAAGEAAVLQYYHTPWTTIEANMDAIAGAGYAAIQVPPPQQSRLTEADQDTNNHPPLGYQPVDHTVFDSEFGTESEFRSMISAAHDHGVDVIVDAVMNHMAAEMGYDFPRFSYRDFHHNGGIENWMYSCDPYDCRCVDNCQYECDPWMIENGDLLGLPDLDQGSSYVRGELLNYLEKIADCGADGVRFDAVKHMPEWFFRDHANGWADSLGLYRVGEVLHGAVGYCQGYADTGMDVTDYPLYYALRDAFSSGGDLRSLDGAGLVSQDSFHALTFVHNHDSDGPEFIDLARAFILTFEGYPRLYKVDLQNDAINNLLWVRNNLCGGTAYTRHADQDLWVHERYNNVLVGINKADSWRSKWVYTSWTNTTLHDYTGNSGDVTTNGDNWVQVSVPPKGWVAYAPY